MVFEAARDSYRALVTTLLVALSGAGCRCESKPMCAEIPSYDECAAAEHCTAILTDGVDGPGWDCELREGYDDGVPLAEMPVILPDDIEIACPEGTELEGDKRTSAWCARPGGTRHGPFRSWYRESGSPQMATQYRDGVEHGLREEWYENGRRSSRTTYERGERVGVATSWHENGRISYREQVGDGLIEWWKPDGAKFKEAMYRDGKEVWQRNLEDGRLGEKEHTEPAPDGGERRYFYYLDDRPRMEFGTVEGKLDGVSLTWWPDGSKRSEASYRAGVLQGSYLEWDQQGRVVRECVGAEVSEKTCTYLNGYTARTAPELPPGLP